MLFLSYLGYALGSKKESFATKEEESDTNIFWIILATIIILGFIWSYGAARLSWGYNQYIGNGWGTSFTFSFLAFIFSDFYYPFYAYFLNPINNIKKKL